MSMGTELPEENEFSFIEPWRCSECGELMYNISEDGNPAPGAPVGVTISIDETNGRYCLLCAQIYVIVAERQHFRDQHKEWLKEQAYKNRLRFGSKYLDGKD